jgi:hypothetical protein
MTLIVIAKNYLKFIFNLFCLRNFKALLIFFSFCNGQKIFKFIAQFIQPQLRTPWAFYFEKGIVRKNLNLI